MNLDVSMMTTMSYEPRPPQRRKNSDDDYYVEETLLFTYNPSKSEESPQKKARTQVATQSMTLQTVEELRASLLIEAH